LQCRGGDQRTSPGAVLQDDMHAFYLANRKEVHTRIVGVVEEVLEHRRQLTVAGVVSRVAWAVQCPIGLVGGVINIITITATRAVVVAPDVSQAEEVPDFVSGRPT